MAVLARFPGGSYRWQCDRCGEIRTENPHRGPRRSACRRCQNVLAYRKRRPLVERRTWQTARVWDRGL